MIDPHLQKQLRRFKKNKRGYYSFLFLAIAFFVSLFSEWICNNKPFVMRFEDQFYFPMFSFYKADTFGDSVSILPDYKRILRSDRFKQNTGNWMLFPIVPYGPNESMRDLPTPPPSPPTADNWLGTDDRGRDLLTRLVYGFRNSMLFALVSWIFIVGLGYFFGALQGYLGGWVDLLGQRFTEIWHALPVLYVIIFLVSVFPPGLWLLMLVWIAFSWISLASYVRAEVLRVRKMEFVTAARALGAGTPRILIVHLFRNTLMPIVTLSPFLISASIGSLAALDYLGLGLPPPTASWGELLRQGKENLSSWWLSTFPFLCLFGTLLLFNFVGEAVRSAFDAREAH
ncbi:MAG: ABC transporter permease subunit [Bdellovibrionales bacterium]|nr:ABC transporter permease subunit [Bdellovibrionales bacterium]